MDKSTDKPGSDADLATLAELASAASPAPWTSFVGPGIGGDDFISVGDDDGPDMYVTHDSKPAPPYDLDFIAAARNLVPSLIDEVRRARPSRRLALKAGGKRPYLAVYDYGTGGVWFYIYAESTAQIKAHYPGLTVITEWRKWMTPERLVDIIAGIGPQMTFDIDHPDGWLAGAQAELRHPAAPRN